MKKLIVLLTIALLALSCTERVPPGYIGMVMLPAGLTGQALQPGNHTAYHRDRLVLIEAKEVTKTEKLSVLCADDLNFKFDLKVRSRTNATDGRAIKNVLNRQGANIQWEGSVGILKYTFLYMTYVKDVARSIARGIVSKYSTTDIRGNRELIQKEIQKKLLIATKGTPVTITMAVTSNFDYPEVITKAVESKRKREIEIGEEKAKQAMALLRAENRMKIALKMQAVRSAEAKAEAIYMEIVGKVLTDKYLQMRSIERDLELYRNVAVGDKVIVTNGNSVLPIIGNLATVK